MGVDATEADTVPPPSPPPLLNEAVADAHWLLVLDIEGDAVALAERLALVLAAALRCDEVLRAGLEVDVKVCGETDVRELAEDVDDGRLVPLREDEAVEEGVGGAVRSARLLAAAFAVAGADCIAASERTAEGDGNEEAVADDRAQVVAVAVTLGVTLALALPLAVPNLEGVAVTETVGVLLGVVCGALALGVKGALAAFAAEATLSCVAVPAALPPPVADAEELAGALWLAVAQGVALCPPLSLSTLDEDVEPVGVTLSHAVLDGVSTTAREALETPLLRPLRVAARGALSEGAEEAVSDLEALPLAVRLPTAEREALVQALAEPLPQLEGRALAQELTELLPQ